MTETSTQRPGWLTLRAALERERAFRVEQLRELAATAHLAPARLGPDDESPRAQALRDIQAALGAGARQALSDIEHALSRMDTGEYGRCETCGEQVPHTVLRAIPQTRICLPCRQRAVADDPARPLRRRPPHGWRAGRVVRAATT